MASCCMCGGPCGEEDAVAVIDLRNFDAVPDDCESFDRAAIKLGYEGWNDGERIFTKAGTLAGIVLHTGIDGMWARVDVSGSMTDDDLMASNIDYRGSVAHLR